MIFKTQPVVVAPAATAQPVTRAPAVATAGAAPATEALAAARADGVADVTRKVAAALRPACTEVLPAVALTITGIIQATEVAAQKVLDETDGLAADRDRLCQALAGLGPFIAPVPESQPARLAVVDAVHALSARVEPLVGAMEFQDLAAQHLRAAIEAVESLRERLVDLLDRLGVSLPAHHAPVRIAAKVGSAAGSSPWRQALADELLNDRAPSPSRVE